MLLLGPTIRFVPFYAAWQGLKQGRWVLHGIPLTLHCICCIVTIIVSLQRQPWCDSQILLPYHMTRSPTHFTTSESAARSDRCAALPALSLRECACGSSIIISPACPIVWSAFPFIILLINLLRRRGPRCATKKIYSSVKTHNRCQDRCMYFIKYVFSPPGPTSHCSSICRVHTSQRLRHYANRGQGSQKQSTRSKCRDTFIAVAIPSLLNAIRDQIR